MTARHLAYQWPTDTRSEISARLAEVMEKVTQSESHLPNRLGQSGDKSEDLTMGYHLGVIGRDLIRRAAEFQNRSVDCDCFVLHVHAPKVSGGVS